MTLAKRVRVEEAVMEVVWLAAREISKDKEFFISQELEEAQQLCRVAKEVLAPTPDLHMVAKVLDELNTNDFAATDDLYDALVSLWDRLFDFMEFHVNRKID